MSSLIHPSVGLPANSVSDVGCLLLFLCFYGVFGGRVIFIYLFIYLFIILKQTNNPEKKYPVCYSQIQYTCVCVCVCVCACVCICIYMCVCVCACVCVCVYVCKIKCKIT